MSKHTTTLLVVIGMFGALSTGCGSARLGTEGESSGGGEGEAGQAEPTLDAQLRWFVEQAGMRRIEGDIAGTLDIYLQASSLCESKKALTVECADVHYEAAGLAYERLDRELSIAEYRKAVDIYLRFSGNARAKAAVALNSIGVMHREMADKTAARNAFEQALQLYQNAPEEFRSKANIQKIEQNIRALDEGYH